MVSFLIFLCANIVCITIGVLFHEPIMQGASYVSEWVKARFAKKPQ